MLLLLVWFREALAPAEFFRLVTDVSHNVAQSLSDIRYRTGPSTIAYLEF